MKKQTKKSVSLKALTKSSVWDLQENDVFRMLDAAYKDVELRDNIRRYVDIIKTAFEMEEVTIDKPEVCGEKTPDYARHRPYLREYPPHLGYETHGSHRPQLRRRLGVALAEHSRHH